MCIEPEACDKSSPQRNAFPHTCTMRRATSGHVTVPIWRSLQQAGEDRAGFSAVCKHDAGLLVIGGTCGAQGWMQTQDAARHQPDAQRLVAEVLDLGEVAHVVHKLGLQQPSPVSPPGSQAAVTQPATGHGRGWLLAGSRSAGQAVVLSLKPTPHPTSARTSDTRQ